MIISDHAAETAALQIMLPLFAAVAVMASLLSALAGMTHAAC